MISVFVTDIITITVIIIIIIIIIIIVCVIVVPVKLKSFVSCKLIKSREGWRKKRKKKQGRRDINAYTNFLRSQVTSQRNGKLLTIML